ncbi:MAG: S-layer homology domain-containing protein [Clostridia bacterium]|nr:S-layer homology domain-containing protein [Clostridia bacterium]
MGEYTMVVSAADGSGAHSELVRNDFVVVSRLKNGILDSFARTKSYDSGIFEDVGTADWFSLNTALVYELGLMNGVDGEHFDPSGNVTLAQAVTLAARIHSAYNDKTIRTAKASELWYQPYVDYVKSNKLLAFEPGSYDGYISRAQFVSLLANSVKSADLQTISVIDDGAVPDVKMTDTYAEEIYRFYRAGVLTGSDTYGSFYPYAHISRAEAAAIITRIVCPEMRTPISLD